jgi:hypothetical protein
MTAGGFRVAAQAFSVSVNTTMTAGGFRVAAQAFSVSVNTTVPLAVYKSL